MKSLILHALVTATVLWTATLTSLAQSTDFTYQGRLQDGGNPVTGLHDFEFRLFNAASGGTQQGPTVTLDDLGVTNGLFTAPLNFGANFPGAGRFLQIGVRPGASTGAYATLSPRQPITSTPYAIQAVNATAAGTVTGGVPAAQITGTLPLAQLPAAVVTNGASGVNISGTFTGNGAGVTNVPLGTINSGGAITWSGIFALGPSPEVGGDPTSVTSADVNGDGKVDLISANYDAGTLTVLTNNGSGGFVLASSPGVGLEPRSVTAVDVNGDGKPDLISANYGANTLTVLTNNGSGGFVLASSPAAGVWPASVTSADVNGDGGPDLISANGALTVLLNSATFNGSFSGNGSGLTTLNAGNLTGAVPPAALTSIPAGNLTGSVPPVTLTSVPAGSLTGSVPPSTLTSVPAEYLTGAVPPAALTSVPAGSLTGTIADARLSANVALLNASQTFGGANNFNASVSFGSQTRQMINLWSTEYALGVQGSAGYFRSGGDFFWYLGGSHSDANGNAGSGGVPLMSLKSSGRLGLGITNPDFPLDVQSGLAVGRFTTTNNANGAVLSLRNTTASPTYLGAINFEDSTTPGQIGYLASGQMTFRVGGADRMNLQAGGLFTNVS